MTFFSRKKILKSLLLLGIAFAYLILFLLLKTLIIFPATESAQDGPDFQLVRVATRPVDLHPQQPPALPIPPTPAPPIAAGGGSAVTASTPLLTLGNSSLMLPHVPSLQEVVSKLPGPTSGSGGGMGDGTGNGDGSGSGLTGIGDDDGGTGSENQAPKPPRRKKTGSTLIFAYIEGGDTAKAKEWLDDGNDPNAFKPSQYRAWAIIVAIRFLHPEIVKLLLDYGANPDPMLYDGQRFSRSIMSAIYVRSPEMLKLLLDHGAKPDYGSPTDPDYSSPPDWTRPSGENSVMQAIDDSANQDMPGYPFDPKKQVEIVKLLLQHGADPQWRDNHGHTPLSLAQFDRRPDLVAVIQDFIKQSQKSAIAQSKVKDPASN